MMVEKENEKDALTVANIKLALVLALVAVGFYVGFIWYYYVQ